MFLKTFKNNTKLIAFTLAETLIVMGIIGVVAALTLPNLNNSTGDKEKVVKLQKVYSNLNDAFGRAVAVYGPVDTWHVNDTKDIPTYTARFGSRLMDFLKVTKNCSNNANENCFYNSYYKLTTGSNNLKLDNNTNYYKFILQDGISVALYRYLDCYNGYLNNDCVLGWSYVDIDGPNKGSHTFAKDLFEFYITENGFVPIGTEDDKMYGNTADKLNGNCFKTGVHCAGWIIKNSNMDYLKATNGKCPNNVQLDWTNTTCN